VRLDGESGREVWLPVIKLLRLESEHAPEQRAS
jgi:hypothetical protein